MDNLIGKKLDGRYLIESLIGVGGMANVYKGTDVRSGNAIAVKVLKEEFLDNEDLVRRFKNESKAISILDHPNIVKVYDVSVTDRLQYIVMEYIDGITLKEYLKQRGGALTWKEVVHFATQVLSALDHAHSKGIVHRDVKPQNIMLQADGSIKMMDFGIARFSRAQSQTVSDKAIGSVHYISPEQAKGDHTDARTDIYSTGVMMYEMLSGQLPFDGTGAVSIAIMQISEKAKPLAEIAPNVPVGLRQITEKAMEKRPEDRFQSAKEMLDAIDAFKHNPSIRFEYEYNSQDDPDKTISRVVNNATKPGVSTAQARRAGTSNTGKGKNVNGKNKKNKKNSKKNKGGISMLPIFFGMAVAFVIGAGILVYLIFTNSTNSFFSNHADVQLISFVGMTQDEFQASDYNAKLVAKWVYEYNDAPEGQIFQQNPKPGRTVKEGQKVTLKVSQGIQEITVPDVRTFVSEDAKQTLLDSGLQVVTKYTEDESVAAGTVVSTDPAAGEVVAGNTTVNMYVARAARESEAIVPTCSGLKVDEARKLLTEKSLVPRIVEQPSTEEVDTVINQSPIGGTTAKLGGAVTLYVSSGIPEPTAPPEPTPDPDGNGATWDEFWNGAWITVIQRDGHVYNIESGEMLW
ncbi:MAG: Stk1 family PASTA domain-containing Ser/Thr kinase [Oscillospiraceae bacterium]|nr:Stk1 family PASTA domain-containing Ser/Thr kinase [Oscillospiraceae bacterium]